MKPKIQFAETMQEQRPDIINFCENCHCISASHFLSCPECNHRPLKKKQITFFKKDLREKQYPIKILTKEELINNFIPIDVVNKLTDEDMIRITKHIEDLIEENYKGYILMAAMKVKNT